MDNFNLWGVRRRSPNQSDLDAPVGPEDAPRPYSRGGRQPDEAQGVGGRREGEAKREGHTVRVGMVERTTPFQVSVK